MNARTQALFVKKDFDRAVKGFWSRVWAPQCPCNELADAADKVFLARDTLAGVKNGLSVQEWDGASGEVDDVRRRVGKEEIYMERAPRMAASGRLTYKMGKCV